MIRLFLPNETEYSSNGEVVIDATKCKVSNGESYTLELSCSIGYADFIQNSCIIVAPTPQGYQPFRIYNVNKTNSKIEVKAKHISYDAEEYIIADAYAYDMTCQEALSHFKNATDQINPFVVISDITSKNNLRVVRRSLNEAIELVRERWSGKIKRDGRAISVLSSIGVDNGITIEYGKNMQQMTANYDFSKVCTKVLPVGRDGLLLDQLYVSSSIQYSTPYTKVVSFEQDISEEDYPDEESYKQALKADLLQQATNYVNVYCYPMVNYTLKGRPERVTDIGDIIRVKDDRLGIDITTEVIAYEYDCIMESYKSLEFGNFSDSLNNLLSNITKSTDQTVSKAVSTVASDTTSAINQLQKLARDLMQNDELTNSIADIINNGFVRVRKNDILLLDHNVFQTAMKIIKFDQTGISYTESGINSTFKQLYSLNNGNLYIDEHKLMFNSGSFSDILGSIQSAPYLDGDEINWEQVTVAGYCDPYNDYIHLTLDLPKFVPNGVNVEVQSGGAIIGFANGTSITVNDIDYNGDWYLSLYRVDYNKFGGFFEYQVRDGSIAGNGIVNVMLLNLKMKVLY